MEQSITAETADGSSSGEETIVNAPTRTSAFKRTTTASQSGHQNSLTLDELQARTGIDRMGINWDEVPECIVY